jgi:hypothetical protein
MTKKGLKAPFLMPKTERSDNGLQKTAHKACFNVQVLK